MRERGEYILSKQVLKSGTSIGANYCEALGAESPQDFIHKVAISLKEANETYYWLDLIYSSNYLLKDKFELGYDAGFGMNTYADDEASYIAQEMVKRGMK